MKSFLFSLPTRARHRGSLLAFLTVCLLLSACGGGGGGGSASAPTPGTPAVESADNVATIVLDSGPTGGAINVAYVSVTLCVPGTTTCQTIDHVQVDTGSAGLRIMASALDPSKTLPVVTNAAGLAVGVCAQFGNGFTWGLVRQADVKIAGEVASALPIQVVSDAALPAGIPADCSSAGANWGSVAALGAKGILGVGLFKEDCGQACAAQVIPGTYYVCTASTCTGTVLPTAKQVANPVAAFAQDNNGVVLVFPAVPAGGAASLSGSLIFGIETRANNRIGAAKVYATSPNGNFTTTYKGRAMTASFLDSGTNGLFFPDSSIARCSLSTDFFCPATGAPLALTAVNTAYGGTASGSVDFSIEGVDSLAATVVAASVGGDSSGFASMNSFDWGLPFFFGRSVFVAIEGASTPRGAGPYWAY